nr:hypothetical protein [Acidiferrobacterales bacterium]
PVLAEEPSMLRFVYRYKTQLTSVQPDRLRQFRKFFDHPMFDSNSQAQWSAESGVEITYYQISEWPNFAALTPSSELIEICTSLLKEPTSKEELLDRHADVSPAFIDRMIEQLDSIGVLKKSSRTTQVPGAIVHNDASSATLYKRIKSFLTRSL